MYDVTAIGELLIDFTCVASDGEGFPTLEAHPGGAPANFLAALAATGAKTALIAAVGADAFGRMLTRAVSAAGVDTRAVRETGAAFTTLAFVTLDEAGEREFSFARKPGADTRLELTEADFALIAASRCLHFGSLSLTDEPARGSTRRAVEFARRRGVLTSFDPNLRPPLWGSLEAARREMLWGLAHADVVKLSAEEGEFILGLGPDDAALSVCRDFGAQLCFVTLGPDGCLWRRGDISGRASAPSGVEIRDTTGAGDIFGGSALAQVLKSGKPPAALAAAELGDIARFACAAATLSASRPGGISSVPAPSETAALLT